MIKKKNILILGVTGFLGFHLAKRVLKLGWNVYGVSKHKPKKYRNISKVKYLFFDLSKEKKFIELNKYSFDHVVNLSGYAEHKNKSLTNAGHLKTVKNLYNYFKNRKLKSFIQIGSSDEYGKLNTPYLETQKCKPSGIYGKSKLKSTTYLINQNRFSVTILRFFLVYGPFQDLNRFMSQLIVTALKRKKFKTTLGNQCRDFLYVSDAINAIIKSIMRHRKVKNDIINIGYGKCIKLKKIIQLVKRETKYLNPIYGSIPLRKHEPLKNYPNIKKAKKKLNWSPKISLHQGIRKTILFYKSRL